MKVLTKKNFAALVLTGLLTVTCAGFMGNGTVAETDEGNLHEEALTNFGEDIMPLSTCTPESPEILYQRNGYLTEVLGSTQYRYFQTYNCFVTYPIKNVDYHATQIWLGKNNGSFGEEKISNIEYGDIFNYVVFPSNGQSCKPSLYLVSAYCKACKTLSNVNATIVNDVNNAYNATARHGCIDYQTSGQIQTSFDQEGSIWEHHGSTGKRIYFSICYNGVAAGDGDTASVEIPWIGYRSTELKVNGVTFTVRTGPKKVSVKASETVSCDKYGNLFAFYVAP